MKSMMTVVLGLIAMLALAVPSAFAAKKTPDLVKLCKKECPGAKDLKATMECVNKKEYAGGPESEKFKKTKCYNTHEEHEDEYKKTAGMSGEHEEKHDEKQEEKGESK